MVIYTHLFTGYKTVAKSNTHDDIGIDFIANV